MRKISDYVAVAKNSADELRKEVNQLIDSGYEPLGGVSVGMGVVVQALVLHAEEDKSSAASDDWTTWNELSFGTAIAAMKRHRVVRRPSFEPGFFIYKPRGGEHLATSGGAHWLPSAEDLLANDWELVPPHPERKEHA